MGTRLKYPGILSFLENMIHEGNEVIIRIIVVLVHLSDRHLKRHKNTVMVVGSGIVLSTVMFNNGVKMPVATGAGTAAGAGIGCASVAGAVVGAQTTGTVAGTGVALAGSSAASGGIFGGAGIGLGALTASTGGLALLVVGTSVKPVNGEITYDCWKPVVHDMSKEPSSGMLLKDLVCHPNVAKVTMTTGICTELPNIVIENIWNETFEIRYMFLPDTEKIACHAKPVRQ